jgi:hypothetical protein
MKVWAPIQEGSAMRHDIGGIHLHILEAAVVQNYLPAIFIDRNAKERCDLPNATRQVCLQIRKVQEERIG